MADPTKPQEPTNTPPADPTGNKGGEGKDNKYTQEQIDSMITARLKEADARHQKELEVKIREAQTEAERLAKLSADEKADEERKKRQSEIDAKEREITIRELKITARDLLSEKGMSTELVDLVVVADADQTKKNVEKLSEAFNKAVDKSVSEKLKGKTPEDPKPNDANGNQTNKKTGTVAF